MGLDQTVYIVRAFPGLKDFYIRDDKGYEAVQAIDEITEPIGLRKEYAVQQFMYETAQRRAGIKKPMEFYAAQLRITLEDIQSLYKLSAQQLTEYAKRWAPNCWQYDEWNIEQVHNFCREVAMYIAFDDCAAYYESDW